MSYADIKQKIADAAVDMGRKPSDVHLVAVTKNQNTDAIKGLIHQGHRLFGENRVQEAMEKYPALKLAHPDLSLHFIGQLQSNKVKDAVSLFDAFHTVDRQSLAAALGEEMQKQNKRLPCFIQVNTGEEPQKGGVVPGELETLLRFAREEAGLDIQGLMCIPPVDQLPEIHFALLHKLSQRYELPCLSMGMSGDFDSAIRWGATHIRIGTALFPPAHTIN